MERTAVAKIKVSYKPLFKLLVEKRIYAHAQESVLQR